MRLIQLGTASVAELLLRCRLFDNPDLPLLGEPGRGSPPGAIANAIELIFWLGLTIMLGLDPGKGGAHCLGCNLRQDAMKMQP